MIAHPVQRNVSALTEGTEPMRTLLVIMVSVLALALPSMAQLAPVTEAPVRPWPTTQFDVYNGDPGFFGPGDEAATPSAAELKKMEDFLSFAAVQMQDWGFPAPALEVIKTETCPACYRIFLGTPLGGANGVTGSMGWSYANGTFDVTVLNRDKLLKNDKFLARAYATAAHELFHTVQHRTKYLYDKAGQIDGNSAHKWITEATAEAVGAHLAEVYFNQPKDLPDLHWSRRFGLRSYAKPLPVENGAEFDDALLDYYTSSLWRYLAEVNHAKTGEAKASMPGPDAEEANYAYLARLFDMSNLGDSPSQELIWLDTGLKHDPKIRMSLARLYPQFLATIAGYDDHRHKNQDIFGDTWRDGLFGRCISLTLSPEQNSSLKEFRISEMAGRCIIVQQLNGSSQIRFDLQIETASEAETSQLWVGTRGGQVLARHTASTDTEIENRNLAIWKGLPVSASEPTVFVLSNVSSNVGSTRPIDGNIQATVNNLEQHTQLIPEAETPDDPGPDGRGDAATKRAFAVRDLITSIGAYAMEAEVADNRMGLKFGLAPAMLEEIGGINGAGGMMDQILTNAEALGANMAGLNESIMAAAQQIETVPGAEVSMSVPAISYGFTGTIEGVSISSSGGDGPDLMTVGPRDSIPGPQREFRPSGTLTITEYSPRVLSGTYSGTLVDPTLTQPQMQQSQPVLRSVSTISGSFSFSAPWINDDRATVNAPADPWQDVETDITNRLPPGMADIGRSISAEAESAAKAGRDPDFSGITTSVGVPASQCDCTCSGLAALERMGQAAESNGRSPSAAERSMIACAMTCAPQYAVCEGE
mgnify:CR=1 FL=1